MLKPKHLWDTGLSSKWLMIGSLIFTLFASAGNNSNRTPQQHHFQTEVVCSNNQKSARHFVSCKKAISPGVKSKISDQILTFNLNDLLVYNSLEKAMFAGSNCFIFKQNKKHFIRAKIFPQSSTEDLSTSLKS